VHSVVRLYCADCTRDREIICSLELVEEIFQLLKDSQKFYNRIKAIIAKALMKKGKWYS